MAPHILIVDADRSAAEVTGALIRRIAPEATLRYASTPYQGWIVAQCAVPDVLIMDPGPQSPASTLLIRLCKETWPLMQIIVLTSARTLGKQMEADVQIDKSVAAPTLVHALQTAIQRAAVAPHPAPFPWMERSATSSNAELSPWIDVQ